jgi:hypothetical protein
MGKPLQRIYVKKVVSNPGNKYYFSLKANERLFQGVFMTDKEREMRNCMIPEKTMNNGCRVWSF